MPCLVTGLDLELHPPFLSLRKIRLEVCKTKTSCFGIHLLILCLPFIICSDEPRIPAGLRAPVKSCRYNGTFYQPGETFANHDLFPSRQTNQCVMCTCSVSHTLSSCSLWCTAPYSENVTGNLSSWVSHNTGALNVSTIPCGSKQLFFFFKHFFVGTQFGLNLLLRVRIGEYTR